MMLWRDVLQFNSLNNNKMDIGVSSWVSCSYAKIKIKTYFILNNIYL